MTIPEIHELFLASKGVSTDTRSIQQGQLFLALKGGNFNGNRYAKQAIDSGAAYAIIDEEDFRVPGKTILVGDVLHTLQQLANYHRQQFDLPVVAITGSNGKTTTKELLYAVLGEQYNVLATKGNLNNHIGVPLTLLEISDETEIAIIEMGANKKGDIRELCSFANPTAGLITNIGKAHLEGFGSIQGIIETKTELFDFLYNTGGTVFVNASQEYLMRSVHRFKKGIRLYQDEWTEVICPQQKSLLEVEYKNEEIKTQLTGTYNIDNISSAIAIGEFFNVPFYTIKKALEAYKSQNNRSQIIKTASGEVVLDAYNANPSSMKGALENLAKFEGQKVAVLGDMFELGSYEEQEHKAVAKQCEALGFSTFLCGEAFSKFSAEFSSISFSLDREELASQLKAFELHEGYHLLIKGSRGMALEKLMQDLKF